MNEITSEKVRELFDYVDGRLLWANGNPNPKHRGVREAGTINSEGYVVITLNGRKCFAHRLVWLWHGLPMPGTVDHINGDKTDNRLENLRAATVSSNGFNSKLASNNKSGVKGVSWCNTYKKWTVQIYAYKKKLTGRFCEFDDAVKFATEKRRELHGEFANDGVAP